MIGFVGLLLWLSGDGLAHETTYARAGGSELHGELAHGHVAHSASSQRHLRDITGWRFDR